MRNAYWGYWLILLGVFVVAIMLLVRGVTSNSTQSFYFVKEITEAAMKDAIDDAYFRDYGEIKMNKEAFYEIFLRRFATEVNDAEEYTIKFIEVYEAPPKVSVEVKGKSGAYNVMGDATNFDVVNRQDLIIEGNYVKTEG